VSVAVALADKLDTLVGFFGIEELPTGSKDPYALRRASLGVIRLITENKLRVNLTDLIAKAHAGYGRGLLQPVDHLQSQLGAFFLERIKVSLKDQGVRQDLIAAAFGATGAAFDITAQLTRLDSLRKALLTDDGKALLALYKRAANILKIEEKKDGKTYAPTPNWILFRDEAEKALAHALAAAMPEMEAALLAEDYAKAMSTALALRPQLDGFFKDVMVNDKDLAIRDNRLALLAQIRDTLNRLADFTQIEGEAT
jgi:glycyl-tRNA synthetase beta chain